MKFTFKFIQFIVFVICLSGIIASCRPDKISQERNNSTIAKILKDSTLWGKDFPAIIKYLNCWSGVAEISLSVFTTRAIGETKYENLLKANNSANRLNEKMKAKQPSLKSSFKKYLGKDILNLSPFHVSAFQYYEDDSFRIGWVADSLEFLSSSLSVKYMMSRFGPPTSIKSQLLQTENERRPIVLTLYNYASGAIIFAESDLASQPGTIDRVIIDVSMVTKEVF